MDISENVLSENAVKVTQSRYFMDGENWDGCCNRVSKSVSSAEIHNREAHQRNFFDSMYNMYFIPAGRILRNCGRPKGSLLNCYNIPISDSIEGIGDHLKNCLTVWSDGGGSGTNYSTLRPYGDIIKGKGGKSSGLVSFLKASDAVSKTIESGGSRRSSGIAIVNISHPEVEKFIDAKLTDGEISHYNISVAVTEDFLTAVENDEEWEYKFNQKIYNKVHARSLWYKILENMLNMAEPGLINWDYLRDNNSYYFQKITGCNPCGEICLPDYGCCDLGSLVLPKFLTQSGQTNWKKLEEIIDISVRFLDNVLDVNKYSIKNIENTAQEGRRIGLGVMGLAEYLFAKKVKYGSEKAHTEIEKLMKFIRDISYISSIKLAEEKGAFPAFDPILYGKAKFVRTLPAKIRMEIKQKGIRNVTLLTIPPTGTTSLIPECSSGCEPIFSKAYLRKDRIGERVYIHPLLKQYKDEVPEWFVDSYDLIPEDHLSTQALLQKYIDSSISKTINVPAETSINDLDRLLLEYIRDIKGCTVYKDGSRKGQILNRLSNEEIKKYLLLEKPTCNMSENDIKCAKGVCEI